MHYNLHLK